MHKKTIAELSRALKNKEFSSVELTKHYLDRIKKNDKTLNAFVTRVEESALKEAFSADQQMAKGKITPLTGIPLAHKDIFCTKGIKTSAGSKMLDNFISPYDATVVKKLKEAGTVMLGKLNMDEFAMGSSNENSYYGPVKNPWNLDTVPGGSSGGSAAAVAARLVRVATGTDTGGSIRQPASFCGITGIKPTYGRVSRFGMIAFASSLDQGGVLANSAEDAAVFLNAMMGFDINDSTSVEEPVPDLLATLNDSVRGLKIGLPKECFTDLMDETVKEKMLAAAKELEKLGAILCDISLPNIELSLPIYYIIAPAECSSNLSRYDGIRYGYRCKDPENLLDMFERSRAEAFGDEVKHRILIGTYVLSSGYYEAYYKKAQKVRQLISNDYQEAFKTVDVILSPTTPSTAFKIGSKMKDRVNMYLSDIFTVSTNLAGLPGLSMPAGFIDNMPIGVQLTGNYFKEAQILNVAHQYQQVTDWHKKIPEGFE
jgi:aspartyl-tRNA(Asn)/glutamyl-tRNA(Gln) amidotransferase subunit A